MFRPGSGIPEHINQKGFSVPTFNLKTAFTEADLQRFLASGSNVVVAKPNAGGSPNVAWVVYRPLLDNTMTWEEQYGIYASNADIVNGATLTQMSQSEFPAIDAMMYPLTPAGYFGPPSPFGKTGSYYTQNGYNNLADKGYLTMGLYQNANVNGSKVTASAVSAAPVIYQSTAEMTPFTTIYLWIQSNVKSNTVVTTVTSPQTIVTFGGSVTTVSLRYDASSGKFVTAGKEGLGEGVELDHIVPALY
jgi:hypothetical protein